MEVVKRLCLASLIGLFSSPVLAETIAEKTETEKKPAEQTAVASATAPESTIQEFKANGSPVVLENVGLSIVPPMNWDVKTNAQMSVIMSEPLPENNIPDYEHAKYRRNITVAAIHEPSVIDEARAAQLKEELSKTFGANSMISEYQVLEHSFFDYKGKKDGLVVYASMKAGGFLLMQMHILVSGEKKQFLMTYTDLADRFRAQPNLMTEAWNSMVTVTVAGEPASRYQLLIVGGSSFAVLAVFIGILGLIRRRRQNSLFSEADAQDFSDEDSTEWSLGGEKTDSGFDLEDEDLPQVSVF